MDIVMVMVYTVRIQAEKASNQMHSRSLEAGWLPECVHSAVLP